jgi:ribose 5-phosphate isomerase B
MASPVVALAADHARFELKNSMKVVLEEHGFLSSTSGQRPPIPSTIRTWPASWRPRSRMAGRSRGLLVCSTGIGIAIAANRYPWVRAAVCHYVTAARLAREHNDANVLALGARLIGPEVARDCLLTFLETTFAGGRHARRVAKMSSAPAL